MKKLFRSAYFWVLFILLSIGCIFAAVRLSPAAFPIVHVDVKMDTASAFAQARDLSTRLGIGPANFKEAASFATDRYFNTFVELEGGGKTALSSIIDKGLYEPYTWQVRHFKPFDAHEVTFIFTPQGNAYGFNESLAEETVLSNLSSKDAQSLALHHATHDWGLLLNDYELVESAQSETPDGRVDHTFVYQKKHDHIGEGQYRVRLSVKGDRFTQMMHFVKVPDEFGRRYQEMRAMNERLSWISQGAVLMLYIFCCGLIGLFFLLKRRWILWRWPLRWAALVAMLNAFSIWNRMPQLWMDYSTALEPTTFILNAVVQALAQFAMAWAFLSLLFAVAEALTRWAFPEQLKLISIWRSKIACSRTVAGGTFAAYLLVPCIIAFQAAFYILTARYLNWWIPSEALLDPNILGTYAPWLEPFTQALMAGSMEECLFRALPLASAALLGNRFGHRRAFIVIAFIIQALIFGSAHANYPMQPAYARMVELFIPSLIFGGFYLAFGLLPAIINHFVFDLVLMSMPLFLSSGFTSTLSTAIVVVLGCIPLGVVLYALLKERHFLEPLASAFNASFVPPPKNESEGSAINISSRKTSHSVFVISFALGILGVVAWLFYAPFKTDVPAKLPKREQALAEAHRFLSNRGVMLDDSWTTTALAFGDDTNMFADEFIWREAGKTAFEALFGSYIEGPHWRVRIMRFSGSVEERAEEYQLSLDGAGRVYSFVHVLPESRRGATLSREEAFIIAREALSKELGQSSDSLVEVSAVAQSLPERTDWYFIWDDKNSPLKRGRAEIGIGVAGNEISQWSKGIHVPEQWIRAKENEDQEKPFLGFFCLSILGAVLAIGVVLGFVHSIGEHQTRKIAFIFFLTLAALMVANAFNILPGMVAGFVTTKSYDEQVTITLLSALGGGIVSSIVLGLAYAYILTQPPSTPVRIATREIFASMLFALFFVGAQTLIYWFFSHTLPLRPNLSGLNSYVPFLSTLNQQIRLYLVVTAFLWLTLIFLNKKADHRWYLMMGSMAMMASGFVISIPAFNQMQFFLILGFGRGLLFALLWLIFFRHRPMLLPLCTATYFALFMVREGFIDAYEHAVLSGFFSALIILIGGGVLFYQKVAWSMKERG